MKYFSADSERKSLAATAALWLILLLSCIFIPIKSPQKHFENISLRIDSPAAPLKSEHQSENSNSIKQEQQLNQTEGERSAAGTSPQAAVPQKTPPPSTSKNNPAAKNTSASSTAAEQKNLSKTAARSNSAQNIPKQSSSQTTSAETGKTASQTPASRAAPRTETLVPSIEELMNNQKRRTSSEKPVWDESVFTGRPEVVSNSENIPQTDTHSEQAEAALAGSAAEAAKSASILPQTAAGKNMENKNTASAQTSGSLGKITDTLHGKDMPSSKENSDGTAGNAAAKGSESPSSTGATDGQTQTGTFSVYAGTAARQLLEPADPKIIIPSEMQQRLTDIKIMVECDISPQGVIPLTSVRIKPAGLLPVETERVIMSQIVRWKFSPAESSGRAQIPITFISP